MPINEVFKVCIDWMRETSSSWCPWKVQCIASSVRALMRSAWRSITLLLSRAARRDPVEHPPLIAPGAEEMPCTGAELAELPAGVDPLQHCRATDRVYPRTFCPRRVTSNDFPSLRFQLRRPSLIHISVSKCTSGFGRVLVSREVFMRRA